MTRKNKWGQFSIDTNYDLTDKESASSSYIAYMLNRTQQMFKYENLPDSITKRNLELMLQTNGHVCVASVDGVLYAFIGAPGGEPDPYYMPTKYTVANPALNLSTEYTINEDCVLIPNDSLYIGLLPLFRRYSMQLVENDITMRVCDINMRITSLISASDDKTLASAKKYIEDIEKGKLGVISESALLDGVRSQPVASTNVNQLTNLIEYHQYLKASWFNELGLQANYNMKRESINSNEAQLNEDALLPLVDDMLECRRLAIEKINNMFGTDIQVYLDSSWEDNQIELELAHEMEDAESSEDIDTEPIDGVQDEDLIDESVVTNEEPKDESVESEEVTDEPTISEEDIEEIVEFVEEELFDKEKEVDKNDEEDD